MIQIKPINKGENMNLNTKEVIYKMLTENTGIHMCDSGGEDGRMWQRNQKKSFNDFKNEPEITKDDDLIYKSLFHHVQILYDNHSNLYIFEYFQAHLIKIEDYLIIFVFL